MGIEVATYITDLIITNPLGSDGRNTTDDHLRLVKSVLKNQFTSLGTVAVTTTAGELNYNDITTLGTVEASKTVTADSNKDITGINILSSTTITVSGILTGGTVNASATLQIAGVSITASAADLNVMDGAIASGLTPTELGYLDGVSSDIQPQFTTINANDWVTNARIATNAVDTPEINSSAVTGGKIAADTISIDKFQFLNSQGLVQGFFDMAGNNNTGSFVTKGATALIYVPANANTLTYTAFQITTDNTGTGGMRLITTTQTGSSLPATTEGGAVWDTEGTLDISDKSGWTEITMQIAGDTTPAETVTVSRVSWAIK